MIDPALATRQVNPTSPNPAPDLNADPAVYEITIRGHLDKGWSAWLGGLALDHDREGYTHLVGLIPDQAALFGVLLQIRDLGLSLISVQRVTTTQPETGR